MQSIEVKNKKETKAVDLQYICKHINAVEPAQSSTHWGMKNSAGLAGCWIIEDSLYGKLVVGARES